MTSVRPRESAVSRLPLALVAMLLAATLTGCGDNGQSAIAVNDSDGIIVLRFERWYSVVAPAHSHGLALQELVGTVTPAPLTVMDASCRVLAERMFGAEFLVITISADNTVTFRNINEASELPGGIPVEDQPVLAKTTLCE